MGVDVTTYVLVGSFVPRGLLGTRIADDGEVSVFVDASPFAVVGVIVGRFKNVDLPVRFREIDTVERVKLAGRIAELFPGVDLKIENICLTHYS